jgi:hypothetical protein
MILAVFYRFLGFLMFVHMFNTLELTPIPFNWTKSADGIDKLACVPLERYCRDLDKFHNREATGDFRAKERGFRPAERGRIYAACGTRTRPSLLFLTPPKLEPRTRARSFLLLYCQEFA